MPINTNQLEYFVAAVRCGSFSLAAKELFVTPQTVSKAVNDLERALQVQLCVATRRTVRPTAFGRVLSSRAAEILSCLADLEELAASSTAPCEQEAEVSLAIARSHCRGNALGEHDLRTFRTMHPNIRITALFRESGACLAAMEEGVGTPA